MAKTNDNPAADVEEQLKVNKSTMTQLLDAIAENQQLKEDLLDREARLQAMTEIINQILTKVNNDMNAVYKEANKNMVILGDVVKGQIEPEIQRAFNSLQKLDHQQKVGLSETFRRNSGLNPLDLNTTQDKQQQLPSK